MSFELPKTVQVATSDLRNFVGSHLCNFLTSAAGSISKIQMPFDIPVRELSKYGVKFDLHVTADVTGRVKLGMFDISGLVTSASKMSAGS